MWTVVVNFTVQSVRYLYVMYSESGGQSAAQLVIVDLSRRESVQVLPGSQWRRCTSRHRLHGFRVVIVRRRCGPAGTGRWVCQSSRLPDGRLPRRLSVTVLRLPVRWKCRRRWRWQLSGLVPQSASVAVPSKHWLPELLLASGWTTSPPPRRRRCSRRVQICRTRRRVRLRISVDRGD